MGTRNLTAVKLKGEYRIAQYGQWDGYPSGQGSTVLAFLDTWDRPKFEKNLLAAQWITDADSERMNAELKEKNCEVKKLFPWLSRDMGAEILQHVHDAPAGIKLKDSIDFAADSLFCEYAYVIDLDVNVLEVYRGFNKEPLGEGERFLNAKPDEKIGKEYYPIKLAKSYPLDDLPDVERMAKDIERDEEKE